MNLRELRAKHPDLFYPQDWFDGELFMERDQGYRERGLIMPTGVSYNGMPLEYIPPGTVDFLSAVGLARLYTIHPTAEIWRFYLWTSDFDGQGQRIFVGDNGKGLEIHRHLRITERWGIPIWR